MPGSARFPSVGILLLLIAVVIGGGCVRREGRNSDCQWPRTPAAGATQRDLIADLEFAEELAIRHMDAHYGPADMKDAAQAKNRCLGVLLGELGKEHGISAQEAFASFGRRKTAVDVAMLLPLVVLLAFAADLGIRRLLSRYPPSDGWLPLLVMFLLASVAFGLLSLMLGQQWTGLAESIRIGTTHLSNRGSRLPISQHPTVAFALATALFLGIGVLRFSASHKSSVGTVKVHPGSSGHPAE